MDTVTEIKRRLDAVEYIGRHVQLQRAGRNFKAICPFHSERTPSFYVFPDRGTWRCFGSCGEGGDIFTFVQKRDGTDFREALRSLAAEAGVQLVAEDPEKRSRREQLARAISAAVDFYQSQLAAPGGAAARDYLDGARQLTADTIAAWNLGWAPDDRQALRSALHARGYDDDLLVAAGLLVEGENGPPRDRFRGRIIIPIRDEKGVFVGLGGRLLGHGEPKYLNSPQTDLFDKGHLLFGLDHAAKAIRELGVAVVVEGYMDVLGPWQAGYRNVVASMGTSLTPHHAALLRRYTKRIVLAMDPDAAGLAAAERAGGLLLAPTPETAGEAMAAAETVAAGELEILVAPLPPDKDPDELVHEDRQAWEHAIASARPFAEFLIRRMVRGAPAESLIDRRRAIDRVRPVLQAVRDPVEQGRYIQLLGNLLQVDEPFIQARLREGQRWRQRRLDDDRFESRRVRWSKEEMLLAILVQHDGLRRHVRNLPPDLFNSAIDREVFLRWRQGRIEPPGEEPDPVAEHAHVLRRMRLPPLGEEDALLAARNAVRDVLKERLLQRHVAVSDDLTRMEKELGVRRVEEVSHEAWLTGVVVDTTQQLAEMVMEQLQLGVSLHREEAPELG